MASLKKRGKRYYEQGYNGRKKVVKALGTSSLQIAKEKLRQHESARFRGEEIAIPAKRASLSISFGCFHHHHLRPITAPGAVLLIVRTIPDSSDLQLLIRSFKGPLGPYAQGLFSSATVCGDSKLED
jgi:hypothetical protein